MEEPTGALFYMENGVKQDEKLHAEFLDNPEAVNLGQALSKARALAIGLTIEEATELYGNPVVGIDDECICYGCDRYNGDKTCYAFPYAIPPTILLALEDHFEPFYGDHGIQFKLIDVEKMAKGDSPGHPFRGNQWTHAELSGPILTEKQWKKAGDIVPLEELRRGFILPNGKALEIGEGEDVDHYNAAATAMTGKNVPYNLDGRYPGGTHNYHDDYEINHGGAVRVGAFQQDPMSGLQGEYDRSQSPETVWAHFTSKPTPAQVAAVSMFRNLYPEAEFVYEIPNKVNSDKNLAIWEPRTGNSLVEMRRALDVEFGHEKVAKGDVEGHPFHGNQWTEGSGSQETRYHTVKSKHWEQIKNQGYLDPMQYEDKNIWSSKKSTTEYERELGTHEGTAIHDDEIEMEITGPSSKFKVPKDLTADDTSDRVTNERIPLSHIRIIRGGIAKGGPGSGDVEGHEFHGNQYTDSIGSNDPFKGEPKKLHTREAQGKLISYLKKETGMDFTPYGSLAHDKEVSENDIDLAVSMKEPTEEDLRQYNEETDEMWRKLNAGEITPEEAFGTDNDVPPLYKAMAKIGFKFDGVERDWNGVHVDRFINAETEHIVDIWSPGDEGEAHAGYFGRAEKRFAPKVSAIRVHYVGIKKGGPGSGDVEGHEFHGNQWTEGTATWDANAKQWRDNEGNELPDHIKGLKIPPGWEGIRYNKNPEGDLLVTAGSKKVIYSARFIQQQTDEKFARIKELDGKFDGIKQEVDADIANGRDVEEASCLRMIMNTGLRPGGSSDAIGATTLQGKNVVELKSGVRLRFSGKSGVDNDIKVTDPEVAKDLLARKAAAGSRGYLFDTNNQKLSDYTHSKDGGGFQTKDFRTLRATRLAQEEVAKIKRLPNDEKTYRKAAIKVAKAVSEKLGNTFAVCLQSYIHPAVFAPWRMRVEARA
jgi:DNA topoisomerase I